MTRRMRRISIFAVLFIAMGSVPAFAGGQLFMHGKAAPFWSDADSPVTYSVNPASARGWVLGANPEQDFVDAVVAAFDTWGAVPTARITLVRGTDSDQLVDRNPNDGMNLIAFHRKYRIQGITLPFSPGVLGVTNVVYDGRTGEIEGAAIILNTDPDPRTSNPDWSAWGNWVYFDMQAVILHEAGHFFGLAHSAVRNDDHGEMSAQPSNAAVMFPYISWDTADARTLDADDIAWLSFVYPSAQYASEFGEIQGDVPFGVMMNGCPAPRGANGAHVVARDLDDLVDGEPRMVVGTYSYEADGRLGRYLIPGLPPGNYGIWIEPLDGSPVTATQINRRIQFTADTRFPEDWHSGGTESGIEADPGNPATAVPVTVTAGNTLTGIDVIVENAVLPGCMSPLSGDRSGSNVWFYRISGQLVLLLPVGFILFLKRRAARRAK